MKQSFWLTMFATIFFASMSFAQEHGSAQAPADPHAGVAAAETHATDAPGELSHPTVPHDPSAWSGTMLIIIAAMFLMAAVIGPIVRAEMPEAAPPHSHDEHHGHGHDEPAHGH